MLLLLCVRCKSRYVTVILCNMQEPTKNVAEGPGGYEHEKRLWTLHADNRNENIFLR